jgi:hypothetical protein
MVKSPTWQLARVYIYTLPFANLDMILENCLFAGVAVIFLGVSNFECLHLEIRRNSEFPNLCIELFSLIPMFIYSNVHCSSATGLNSGLCQIGKNTEPGAVNLTPNVKSYF